MSKPFLIYDDVPSSALPHHFRTMHDTVTGHVDTAGLEQLYASASGQFSAKTLPLLRKKIGQHCIVIDLRGEVHGFVNDDAVTLYTRNKHFQYVQYHDTSEQQFFKKLAQHKEVEIGSLPSVPEARYINNVTSHHIALQSSMTEQELCSHHHLNYVRIALKENSIPNAHELKQLVTIIMKAHHKKEWLHIHCRLGQGRTTMVMAMYDMLVNADKVSFKDILRRQFLIGGYNLDTNEFPQRHNFLKQFYIAIRKRLQRGDSQF